MNKPRTGRYTLIRMAYQERTSPLTLNCLQHVDGYVNCQESEEELAHLAHIIAIEPIQRQNQKVTPPASNG